MNQDERRLRRHHRLELAATVLLSFATFGSAWAAWRSSVWNGVQSYESSQATHYLTESIRASTRAQTREAIDVATFLHWLQAKGRGEERYAADLARRFRAEFRPVFEAWLARPAEGDGPLELPPDSPFVGADYQEAKRESLDLQRRAEEAGVRAAAATSISNDFVLTAVLYASVLFLAGVSLKVEAYGIRLALVILAGVLLCATVIFTALLQRTAEREAEGTAAPAPVGANGATGWDAPFGIARVSAPAARPGGDS